MLEGSEINEVCRDISVEPFGSCHNGTDSHLNYQSGQIAMNFVTAMTTCKCLIRAVMS